MATPNQVHAAHVLRVETVKQAIETLVSRRVHSYFIAYLHLRARALEAGTIRSIEPAWNRLKVYLAVTGGPPHKPFYRPLMHRVRDPSGYWMNPNLAGSFAPSSLREEPKKVLDVSGPTLSLRPNHAQLARHHLLFGEPLPVWALTAFMYREFGLRTVSSPIDPDALVAVFRHDFGFDARTDDDSDFRALFDPTVPDDAGEWYTTIELEEAGIEWMPADASTQRSAWPVRTLTANELDIGSDRAVRGHASNRPDDSPLDDDDHRLRKVAELGELYGGVIFTGPPGTSKTWYAARIAEALVEGDEGRIRYVQFHPSYQYEDFMQGFVPKKSGDGFELADKLFVNMCAVANGDPNRLYVLVIDELSRGDPGRIFGEALTYIERSKRGIDFQLASGDQCVVPHNLLILATMNPLDRGVDEVDAAFERRFAKIAMEPDDELLVRRLEDNGVQDPFRARILGFFRLANKRARANPLGAVGHTYFWDVQDEASLHRIWEHQLRFMIEKAYRLDSESRREIEDGWHRIFSAAPLRSQPTQRPAAEVPEVNVTGTSAP